MSNILLVANLVAFARAGYTEWYFSGNNSCPGLGIACITPSSMCAYDSVADKAYCCSGESYDICRAFAATCGGSDGGPSSSQQQCTSGSSSWCCLQDSERCTQRTGQVNVCVATQDNPIAEVSDMLLNETFSSLSSASPSASTFSVDVVSLAARATATSSSQSSTATEAATSTSADTASTTSTSTGESNDLGSSPTGAIAGGVVGGVAGLAVIGAIVWLLLRRRSKKQAYEPPTSPLAAETEKHDQFGAASPGYSTPAPQYHIAEMEGTREINEMPGHGLRSSREIKELPSGQAEVRELPA
ncbi:hypothetical protein Slin15195_G031990 [Septoria linicola]|uniref:Mid2 domain-containing protein n=1 Tax=Septoria linicola TaxID=215465 RepID=A0A9Q9AIX0_9PEZI|nr:hypothetical protein Slin14017_G031010 [Septoria linicola]USW49880.1 hypothetical protein Slin15195_G031990 [Septoria linicola]